MRHTTLLLRSSLIYCRGNFLYSQLRRGRSIRSREHPTSRRQFDPISACSQYFTCNFAYLVNTIGYPARYIVEAHTEETKIDATGIETITMASSLRNHRNGNLHTWPGNNATLNG